MLKKALLVSAMAMSSTIVLAATPYVGGSLGLTDLGVYNTNTIKAGAIGKLFGGYGSTFGTNKNIYLGGELNLDVGHYVNSTGTTYGLGASFLPGVMLSNDTMLYGRLGLELNRRTSSAVTNLGTQYGLGVQTSVAKNWDARFEYVHVGNLSGSQLNLGLVYKFN